ncbi:MAG: glycosyltransferase [Proteobacteria bacterium]|nr:MAG: glycosyltransferase [Pseudomonadota bacterium]
MTELEEQDMNKTYLAKIQAFMEATPFSLYGNLDDKVKLKEALEFSSISWKRAKAVPLISIIMPLYNTDPLQFETAILSLLAQCYPNWELITVDDGSKSRGHMRVVEEYTQAFPNKIRFIQSPVNEGISASRNKAITLSKGDLIGILDHDDILHPLAISEMVKAMNSTKASFAHSFEVKITEDGHDLREFLSKPAFSWFTLLHVNYICHFSVLHRKLLDSVQIEKDKWFDAKFDGAEDHELFIRCSQSALFKPTLVPQFLYMWRMSAHSTSADQANKPLSKNRNITAALTHLKDGAYAGSAGDVFHPFRTHTFLKALPRSGKASIAVIDTAANTEPSRLNRLMNQIGARYEFLSGLVKSAVPGSSSINEQVRRTECEYILFAHPNLNYKNTEIVLESVQWLERFKDIGSVGISILDIPRVPSLDAPGLDPASYPIHTAYSVREMPGTGGGLRFSSFLEKRWFAFESRQVLANTRHFMLVRRSDFIKVDGFDSDRFERTGYDLDLCLRLSDTGLTHINLGLVGVEGHALEECKMGYGEAEQVHFYSRSTANMATQQLCYNHAFNMNQLVFG